MSGLTDKEVTPDNFNSAVVSWTVECEGRSANGTAILSRAYTRTGYSLNNNGSEDADGMEEFLIFLNTPDNSRSGCRLIQTVVLQWSRNRHHLRMRQGL